MSEERTVRVFPVALLLVALFLTGGAAYGYSRSTPGPPAIAGVSTLTPPVLTPSPDEVARVSRELYCPLCPGVRLDTCDLPLCDQMRGVIRQRLAAGETTEQIKAYFVEQYGQVVLGVPPKRGGTILAWVLPFLVVLVAGGWVYFLARRWTRQRAAEKTEAPVPQPLPAEYLERLERDLEQFE